MRYISLLMRRIPPRIVVAVTLLSLWAWQGDKAQAQANFTGMIKPIDCVNYTGTDADYSTSYTTLFRDTENGRKIGYYEGIGSHPGVDIARLSNGKGDAGTPITAIYGGYVKRVLYSDGTKKGWGNCLVIKHTDIPDAGIIYSCYGHMVSFEGTWHENDVVSKGQVIGYIGTTGNSSGPHLHFQIDKDYSDYGGLHPWFPADVNTVDSNGIVLNHSINPMKFVQDHSNASGGGGFDPTNPYVDGNFTGTQTGTASNPFKTVGQAISAANVTQATVHIKPGIYGEKISTSKHILFVTWGSGTVRIGG